MKRPDLARRSAAVVAVVAALLGLSGCFKASQDVEVRADGSGSVTLHIDLNKRALASLVRGFGDLGSASGVPGLAVPFKPVDRTFPDGTKVRAVDTADRATLDASFDFDAPEEYRRKMQQVSQAISNNPDLSLPDDGTLGIRREGRRVEVTLEVGSALAGAGDVDFAALSGLLDPDARPEFVVTITMPGRILSTNGTTLGRTVTWDLLSGNAPATLTASSSVARTGLPAWAVPVGVGLVVVLLLALLGVLVGQRRRPAAADLPGQPAGQPRPAGTATFFPPARDLPTETTWPAPDALPPPPPVPAPPEAAAAWPAPPGAETQPSPVPEPVGLFAPAVPPAAPEDPDATATSADDASPAEPEAAAAAPVPGWYTDPAGSPGWRYWDGASWTSLTS